MVGFLDLLALFIFVNWMEPSNNFTRICSYALIDSLCLGFLGCQLAQTVNSVFETCYVIEPTNTHLPFFDIRGVKLKLETAFPSSIRIQDFEQKFVTQTPGVAVFTNGGVKKNKISGGYISSFSIWKLNEEIIYVELNLIYREIRIENLFTDTGNGNGEVVAFSRNQTFHYFITCFNWNFF